MKRMSRTRQFVLTVTLCMMSLTIGYTIRPTEAAQQPKIKVIEYKHEVSTCDPLPMPKNLANKIASSVLFKGVK